MDPAMDWTSPLITLLTGGGVMGIAKFFLAQSARKLEEIPREIQRIRIEMAKIEVHISEVARLKETVREHDRLLSILMAHHHQDRVETGRVISPVDRSSPI